jgi:chemotaxis protein methyltransferase CheR
MRWEGFRKVRRQVCKRIIRRVSELGLEGLGAYGAHLERHPEEWAVLDRLTHITISRFYRDRGVFALLQREVLPGLADAAVARGSGALELWSAGCASGEEAYTVAIIWQLELAARFPAMTIKILATDVDDAMLARAQRACFTAGSLKELPGPWREAAFHRDVRLREPFREPVTIARHDIRRPPPNGPFDLVMCRNLAFTYFDLDLQRATASRLADAVRPGGALVLGSHEAMPEDIETFEPWGPTEGIYRRTAR